MTDTKELVEQVREALELRQVIRGRPTGNGVMRNAIAALSELEARLKAVERSGGPWGGTSIPAINARAEAAEAQIVELEARLEAAEHKTAVQIERNRELHKLGAQQRDAMERRAEAAERERDELRAILPETAIQTTKARIARVAELEEALREIADRPLIYGSVPAEICRDALEAKEEK